MANGPVGTTSPPAVRVTPPVTYTPAGTLKPPVTVTPPDNNDYTQMVVFR